MKINYKPKGTCSTDIELEVQDGRIEKVVFKGGCNGNLQGISSLVKGMRVEDVISRLEGIHCGVRSTSLSRSIMQGLKGLTACLNFTRVRFENFFGVCFSVFMRMIAGYLTSENGKKTGRKHKNDLIIFFCRKNLDRLLESVW